jgi:hypothetical protein
MDDEYSRLITASSETKDGTVRYKLPGNGQWYISGGSVIHSSYADKYDSAVLGGVLTERELKNIVSRLNDKLQSHWPCSPVLLFGALCCPCSLGASLFFPQFCLTQGESAANDMLSQVSMKARFYDHHIEFAIVKHGWCQTYLEIRFPSRPHLRGSADSNEFGSDHIGTTGPVFTSEPIGAFVAQPEQPSLQVATTSTNTTTDTGSNKKGL